STPPPRSKQPKCPNATQVVEPPIVPLPHPKPSVSNVEQVRSSKDPAQGQNGPTAQTRRSAHPQEAMPLRPGQARRPPPPRPSLPSSEASHTQIPTVPKEKRQQSPRDSSNSPSALGSQQMHLAPRTQHDHNPEGRDATAKQPSTHPKAQSLHTQDPGTTTKHPVRALKSRGDTPQPTQKGPARTPNPPRHTERQPSTERHNIRTARESKSPPSHRYQQPRDTQAEWLPTPQQRHAEYRANTGPPVKPAP
ncbi:proline-rich receptor-like protein kinase PERK10, partial [Micropterus dolomieu]|uniref:proline-rich receptor-like protein kinase PERK10 n=1 Tax=Micropterus dolomieu TaxID=147949 RepID=UPI001E8CAB19